MRSRLGSVVVLTLACLAALPAARARDDEPADPAKVSNDDPGRPLQMPPATTETREALEDFERFRARAAWERAFKALDSIPEDQAERFVDGADGFVVSVARRRRDLLAALPPEGLAAYRLFHDADAGKLFEKARDKADLERLYSTRFATTIGPMAADRLGDLYFEEGRFDRAADCWLAALRRTDADIPPAPLAVKAAVALFRGERRAEFAELKAEIEDRRRDETVQLGGRTETAPEALRRIAESDVAPGPTASDPAASGPIAPADGAEPAWRFPIADSIEAGMGAIELDQWRATVASTAAPSVAVDGGSLYLNHLGRIFALDLATGKIRWRTGPLHDLRANQGQALLTMIDPARRPILAGGGFVWNTTRDPKDQNPSSPFRFECRRAEDGDVLWTLAELPEMAGYEPIGPPLLADGVLFLPASATGNEPLPRTWVLALRPEDGRLIWKTEIASARQTDSGRYSYGIPRPKASARLILRSGSLYVDTHAGILARLDAAAGTLDWGFAYETKPAESPGRFFFNESFMREPVASCEPPATVGDLLLFKGFESSVAQAIDPDRATVAWRRPIGESARIAAVEGRTIYLGGDDLAAMDADSRELRWAVRLPGGSHRGTVVARPDGIWQATPRGVFELDPQDGAIRRIFRGDDLGVDSADLLATPDRLLIVTNRSVTAHLRSTTPENAPR